MHYPVKIIPVNNENIITILATINNSCNLDCYYCYNAKPRTNKKLDLNKLYDFIFELNRQTNKKVHLHLLGGEPSLHPLLKLLIEKVKQNINIVIIIYTNFHLQNDFFIGLIYDNIRFNITYHYKENLNKFVLKINDFVLLNAKVDLTLMYEYDLYLSIVSVYNNLKTNDKLESLQILLIMDNLKEKKLYSYTKKQLELYENIVNKDKENTNAILLYNDNSCEMLTFYDILIKPKFSTLFWKCWAGIDYLEIDLNGDVYPCILNSKKIFNINDSILLFKVPNKPIICKKKYCNISCLPITKEKIFK